MTRAYFITGTDTNIGKTLISVSLLKLAQQTGLSTLGLKPVSAGCEIHDGILMNADARELMQVSSVQPDYATVNPLALKEPMAPHIAAECEHRTIDCATLIQHCRDQLSNANFTVIEGAGGWQVPLNAEHDMADLAAGIGCPVIMVVGLRLGCINHSLLTAAAIEARGLRLAGWVANQVEENMPVADENVATLETRINAPLLGRIPWLSDMQQATDFLHLPD